MAEQPTQKKEPPISRLAVAALVLVLVPGCPIVSVVGALLGLAALRRIQASAGALGGRRIAGGAVVAGWFLGLAWTVIWWQLGSVLERGMRESMKEQVRIVIATDDEALAGMWAAELPSPPSAEALAAFRTAFADRYGALERISITSYSAKSGDLALAGILFCERGEPLAAASFDMPFGTLNVHMRELRVSDKERGDLVIPEVEPVEAEGGPDDGDDDAVD